MGLGGVFQEQQAALATKLRDRRHVGQLSVEMDRQDRFHVGRQRRVEFRGSEIKSLFVGLDEHRAEAVLRDCEDRGDIGVRRDRDGVAVLEQAEFLPAAEGEDKGRQAVRRPDAMRRTDPGGELGLKSLHLVAKHIPA